MGRRFVTGLTGKNHAHRLTGFLLISRGESLIMSKKFLMTGLVLVALVSEFGSRTASTHGSNIETELAIVDHAAKRDDVSLP